jgi:hypothetical protein
VVVVVWVGYLLGVVAWFFHQCLVLCVLRFSVVGSETATTTTTGISVQASYSLILVYFMRGDSLLIVIKKIKLTF